MLAEASVGLSWSGASRPLTPVEVLSGVQFGELDRAGQEAAQLITRLAADVHDATLTALADDLATLGSSTDPYDVLERLQQLGSPTAGVHLPMDDVLDDATRKITDVLARLHIRAAGQVLAEAESQGLPAAVLADQNSLAPNQTERRALEVLARQVAEAPIARVLTVATKEARSAVTPNTPVQAVLEAVRVATDAITPDTMDVARQAATSAVNSGRLTAALSSPEPEQVYASELLDGRTCGPCASVDGRMYETLDDALVDYPSGGSYRGCLGGARCRGTLVFVWATEAAPTLDHPGDRALPTHIVDRTPRGPTQLPGDVADSLPLAVGGTPTGPPVTPRGPSVPPTPPPVTPGPSPVTQPAGRLTSDQYDVLRPEAKWSEARRREIVAALSTDPNAKALLESLQRFQHGGNISRLRTNIEKHLTGQVLDPTSTAKAEALLDAIRHAPDDWAPDTLYRGMTVKGKLENVLAKYTNGDPLDLSLTSFTTDRKVAKRFQHLTSKGTGGETRIMVELIGDGKKVLPIQNLTTDFRLFKEKEWVSAGQYRIVEAKKSPDGGIILRITQEGTF